VDAEIDAEADEEHGEGHRDKVQRADGEGREAGGPGEARHQGDQHRHHQAPGLQPGEEHHGHEDRGDQADDADAGAHGDQFVLQHQRLAGEPQAIAVVPGKAQVPRRRLDRRHRRRQGLQRGEVDHRLGDDEAPAVPRRLGRAGDQRLPGDTGRGVGLQSLGGLRHLRQQGRQGRQVGTRVLPRILPHILLSQRFGQQAGQAAQARVLLQGGQQRLGLGQAVTGSLQLVQRQEQQAVAPEEGAAFGQENRLEGLGAGLQRRGQARRALLRRHGVRALDGDGEGVLPVRKGAVDGAVVLPPGQLLGQHVFGGSVDRQGRGGKPQQPRRGRQAAESHGQGTTADPGDPGGDPSADIDRTAVGRELVFSQGHAFPGPGPVANQVTGLATGPRTRLIALDSGP